MIKKFCALLLFAVISIGGCINAYAFDIYGEKSVYEYDFKKGETFYVNFMLGNNDGFNNATFRVKYNPNVIKMVGNDITDDEGFITYNAATGVYRRLFSNSSVEEQINLVPSINDPDYERLSDGVKTAAEIGIVKLGTLVYNPASVFDVFDDGIFLSLKFEMVGAGKTDIEILPSISKSGQKGNIFYATNNVKKSANIESVEVNLKSANSSSNSDNETETSTMESTTEITTNDLTESTTEKTTKDNSTDKKNNRDDDSTEVTTKETIGSETDKTNKISFKDISVYPWAVKAIEELASRKIVNGVGNENFAPALNVKRADFVVMLMNCLGETSDSKESFADVNKDMYYANAIGRAKELGIAKGDEKGNFNPNANISRQDMMVFAARALEAKGYDVKPSLEVLNKFDDFETISDYAKDYVSFMVNEKIVNGMGNNIAPKENTTRAQSAVIVYNILNLLEK